MKVSERHKKFLAFLQGKEKSGNNFSQSELINAVGWKGSTFETYLNKGQLSDFLSQVAKDQYEATNTLDLSEVEFAKKLSQSKHRRGLGHNCKSKLAKALLRKSKENMLLALELYNRPSLENRMDAFVMCFCTAWDQLLKAIIIESKDENAIFRKEKKGRIKETISLRNAIDEVFSKNDKVRKNLEEIVFFRDQAVHLLMPEIQGVASRLFQSGVLNYSSRFEEFTEQSFLNSSHTGMISLVGDFKYPPISVMENTYGETAKDILALAESLTEDIQSSDDIEFAIPLNVKLVFAKDPEAEGQQSITLVKAEEGMEGLKKALVVSKTIDREKSHPYLENVAIKKLNTKLNEVFTENELKEYLVAIDSKNKKPTINSYCFRAILAKLKIKNGNNKYHYKNNNPEIHYYSEECINHIIDKIKQNNNFVSQARQEYSNQNRTKK